MSTAGDVRGNDGWTRTEEATAVAVVVVHGVIGHGADDSFLPLARGVVTPKARGLDMAGALAKPCVKAVIGRTTERDVRDRDVPDDVRWRSGYWWAVAWLLGMLGVLGLRRASGRVMRIDLHSCSRRTSQQQFEPVELPRCVGAVANLSEDELCHVLWQFGELSDQEAWLAGWEKSETYALFDRYRRELEECRPEWVRSGAKPISDSEATAWLDRRRCRC